VLRIPQEDSLASTIGQYLRRAREERELASKVERAEVAQAHIALAKQYEALVAETQTAPDGRRGADAFDVSGYMMSAQKLFPFHAAAGMRPHFVGR
jgi:hypothetical protein